MKFPQLEDPKINKYLTENEGRLVCVKKDVPDEVIKLFETINKEYMDFYNTILIALK